MIVPERFLLFNSWLCAVLGYALNGVLLWLIARHTSTEMASYTPILLLSILLDLAYLAVIAMVVPVVIVASGRAVFVLLGPLASLHPSSALAFSLLALWLFFAPFSTISLAAPFVYRYLAICWGMRYGLQKFLAVLVVPTMVSAGYVALYFNSRRTHTFEEETACRQFFFNDSAKRDIYVIPYFTTPSTPSKAIFLYLISSLVIVYAAVVFCGWRVYRHLTRMASGHMKKEQYGVLQLQLSTALLLQAVVPLVVLFAPTVVLLAAGIVGVKASGMEASVYKTGLNAWVPVVNPLIAIWVLKAYRQTVAAWLKRGLGSITVHPAETMVVGAGSAAAMAGQQQQPQQSIPLQPIESTVEHCVQ